MKQLIIALFALLSINVSAQTLYDRVQETIVKPLKEYGIMVGQATTNYHHTRKDLMLTIPLWNTLDTTTNSSVETLNKNAAISKQAGKYQKAYELLLDRLQQLRTSAYESYWWEKNYCDSMMISMSWNPTKDYKTYTTFQKTMPRQFGADYIQVTKIKNNNYSNRNSHLPKWCVAFQLTYASDTTIVGTKLSQRPADHEHPFGYGRVEYFSAIIIAVIVLSAGITSFIESAKKIFNPTSRRSASTHGACDNLPC